MSTQTDNSFVKINPAFEQNKNWFEIWSTDVDGSLKECVNFYDFSLENCSVWAAQCLNTETNRTEEVYVVAHATKTEGEQEKTRSILPERPEDIPLHLFLKRHMQNFSVPKN